ncbi:creatininase family protein [Alicyclobacillus fodiniaquatilis]|uniref:Creatininase family protein n=1 Tax=Alicyclobacillus fodiniaquatilis TaxID=1661150 RepID=A0ABW4JNE7_9BACL
MTAAKYWWGCMPERVSERFLGRYSTTEITQMADDGGVVLIPLGATEQHGPHLPLFTDTLIVQSLVAGVLADLPENHPFYFIYPLAYSYSMEHIDFPGTISLSAETTMKLLMDVADALAKSGFRKIVFLNGHGGNVGLLHVVAREIRIKTGISPFVISGGSLMEKGMFDEVESRHGIHAGAYETALLQSLIPNWVDTALSEAEYPAFVKREGQLSIEGSFAVAWKTKDLSASGVIGDPNQATPEMGGHLFSAMVAKLADVLMEIAQFDAVEEGEVHELRVEG